MKQGLTAHKADSLLENVGRQVADVARDVQLVQRAAGRLGQPRPPRLLDVLALHAAIAKTQVRRCPGTVLTTQQLSGHGGVLGTSDH